MRDIIELRSKAKGLEPVLRIGKNGLTEGTVREIKHILIKRRMIKIKLLKSFYHNKNKKELVKEIVDKTNSILVESVGNVIVLHKK
ncbi:YhbY family RNA-binding protein [Candidatus Woesearchaeota archaeon]|nr:YhbY family RNA-binding protein [Candidatus Woesearchaeota archaeon]